MPNLTPQIVSEDLVSRKEKITDMLPSYINVDRFIQVIDTEVSNNPRLLQCTKDSVIHSVMEACAHGVEPSSVTGLGSLVPFGRTCTFILGYQGIVELAHRAGHTIWAYAVYANDPLIEVCYGTDPYIKHRPLLHGPKGGLIGSYAVADLGADRPRKYQYMSIDDLREHSKYSKNKDMWKKHTEAMSLKTVIRKLGKTLSRTNTNHNGKNLTDADRFALATRSSDDPHSGLTVDIDSGEFKYIDAEDTNSNEDNKNGEFKPTKITKQVPSFSKQKEGGDKQTEERLSTSKSKARKKEATV